MNQSAEQYYVPHGSLWPIVASVSLTVGVIGAANWFNGNASGPTILYIGLAMVVFMMFVRVIVTAFVVVVLSWWQCLS